MPRLLLATVAALALAAPAQAITFNHTGNLVFWTAPEDGTYEIVATGAQGGSASQTVAGGRGALIGGYFELSGGTVLQIAVGGMGVAAGSAAGGGGGSFVVTTFNNLPILQTGAPLVIAGGGGGVRSTSATNAWDANTGQAGVARDGTLLTGQIGFGGPASADSGGGGGFDGDGFSGSSGGGGMSWPEGLAGGTSACFAVGGFGGGGGAGCGSANTGGGGGFSGGAGGTSRGGGGGSFNADTLTGWSLAGAGIGNGLVTINLVVEEVTTPEPASATLALLGLFGLTALRRRR